MRLSVGNSNKHDKFKFINFSDIEFTDEYGIYHDDRLSLITQPNDGFKTSELEIKELLNNLIDEFIDKTEIFCFCNPHEIFNWKYFWDLFQYTHQVFEDRGILDRLIFSDNNSNFKFKDNMWKYSGLPYLLGMPILDNVIDNFDEFIQNKKFEKHFLSLNRRPKDFRTQLVRFLVDSELDKKSFYSFGVDGDSKTHPLYKVLDTTLETISPSNDNFNFTGLEDKSFCHIITEAEIENVTSIRDDLDSELILNKNLYSHISEKTTRAISAGMPFIIISSAHSLNILKSYGFKTFSKWWDESYDDELDWDCRFKKIKNILLEISSKSLKECTDIYNEMKPILIHNRKIHDKLKLNYKKFDNMGMVEVVNFPNELKYFKLFKKLRN